MRKKEKQTRVDEAGGGGSYRVDPKFITLSGPLIWVMPSPSANMSKDSDFLKNLPTHNRENFSRLHSGDVGGSRTASTRHRSVVYIPSNDYPSEQV